METRTESHSSTAVDRGEEEASPAEARYFNHKANSLQSKTKKVSHAVRLALEMLSRSIC